MNRPTKRTSGARLVGLLALLWLGLALIGPAHAGTTYYYYTDAQGTVLAKADAQGNIVARYDYKPYGAKLPGPQTKGPTGYTGHVNDAETGLVYMQARYYDPVVGRFLSVDPVGPKPGNGFGFNRYAYANNNPINHVDPAGKCVEDACVVEVSAVTIYVVASILVAAGVCKVSCGKIKDGIEDGAENLWHKITQDNRKNAAPPFTDHPGNKVPVTGVPGSKVRGGTGSRTYGPDGYPETDREVGHPDEKGPGNDEHSHDWGRPEGGGRPSHKDRGPPRPPQQDDPPSPRGPNIPPPEA